MGQALLPFAAERRYRWTDPHTIMKQPVPQVSSSDLDRVVERDFPIEARAEISTLLDAYGDREAVRVKLAILKLAAGDVSKVRHYVGRAVQDYRDVLAWAEYPGYMDNGWSRGLPAEKRDAVIASDWEQYDAWLKR
jgi:hypothetical protein